MVSPKRCKRHNLFLSQMRHAQTRPNQSRSSTEQFQHLNKALPSFLDFA